MSVDLESVNRNVKQLATELGRSVLHQIYPKDFEYYMMALELVDGSGKTIDYFAFPIMPSSIVKSENKRITVKKAYKSTLILTSSSFIPQDITLRGNFGKSFKILVGVKEVLSGVAFFNSIRSGVFELNQTSSNRTISVPINQFSHFVKTGYGAIKILQSIIHKSDGNDANGPYQLYLYNFALGESYLVVAPNKSLILEQNDQNMNMIWNYTLNLTIIAPLEMVRRSTVLSSFRRVLETGVIQGSVNKTAREVSSYISRIRG